MMEPSEEYDDEGERQVPEYQSPYPIEDRHLLDSVYTLVRQDHQQVEIFSKAYRTLKSFVSLLLFAVIGAVAGLMILALMNVLGGFKDSE